MGGTAPLLPLTNVPGGIGETVPSSLRMAPDGMLLTLLRRRSRRRACDLTLEQKNPVLDTQPWLDTQTSCSNTSPRRRC
mgnify:CR=1 FL=1